MNKRFIVLPKKYLLPNPYLIVPTSLNMDDTKILLKVFYELTLEENNQDLMKTITCQQLFYYQKMIVSEFYKRNNLLPGLPIDNVYKMGNKHHLKPLVNAEILIWNATFKMLEEMCSSLRIFNRNHPINLLYALIRERQLLLFIFTHSNKYDNQRITKNNFLKQIQSQNRKLNKCNGAPFDKEESPFTWFIIEQAMALANTNYKFRKNFYMPAVNARQSLTSSEENISIKYDNFRVYREGEKQQQGRKKEKNEDIKNNLIAN